MAAPLPPALILAMPIDTSWLPVIPGPFILLLFLPLFPLVLLSIGARPPKTDSLPFSTDEIWQTAGLVTAAGSVALCTIFYPGAAGEILHWVKGDGSSTLVKNTILPVTSNVRHRQTDRLPKRQGTPLSAPLKDISRNGARAIGRPTISTRQRHLTHLRQGVLHKWYSANRPSILTVLSIVLFILILFFSAGHLIGAAFDAEQANYSAAQLESKGKRWQKEQISMRKKYKDDERRLEEAWAKSEKQTEQEGKSQKPEDRERWQVQRDKDSRALVEELEGKNLPLIGLEGFGKRSSGRRSGGGSKESKVQRGKSDKELKQDGASAKAKEGNRGTDAKKSEKKDKGKEANDGGRQDNGGLDDGTGKPKKEGIGVKLKRAVFGKQLAAKLEKDTGGDKASSDEANPQKPEVAPSPVTAGPAWKPADDAITQAALAASQARAQAMADSMRR